MAYFNEGPNLRRRFSADKLFLLKLSKEFNKDRVQRSGQSPTKKKHQQELLWPRWISPRPPNGAVLMSQADLKNACFDEHRIQEKEYENFQVF